MFKGKTSAFYTLGCKLNFSETSTIARSFSSEGFERVDFSENADILSNRQYILTLNSDKLHADEIDALKMNIDNYKRASFTKDKRFLKNHYQEL